MKTQADIDAEARAIRTATHCSKCERELGVAREIGSDVCGFCRQGERTRKLRRSIAAGALNKRRKP